MATTAAAPKVDKTPAETREYIVLMQTSSGSGQGYDEAWTVVGRAMATTREDALETVVDKLPADEQEGTFIAVASRYWVEVSAVVQVKRTRSWS
jgi:hypothetical protein